MKTDKLTVIFSDKCIATMEVVNQQDLGGNMGGVIVDIKIISSFKVDDGVRINAKIYIKFSGQMFFLSSISLNQKTKLKSIFIHVLQS